jgi:hypothetical protein
MRALKIVNDPASVLGRSQEINRKWTQITANERAIMLAYQDHWHGFAVIGVHSWFFLVVLG